MFKRSDDLRRLGEFSMKPEGRIRTNWLDWLSLALVIVGALNWGLVGVGNFLGANWNLVTLIFGSVPALESLIYVVVGLAAIYELYFAYQLFGARHGEMEMAREKPA